MQLENEEQSKDLWNTSTQEAQKSSHLKNQQQKKKDNGIFKDTLNTSQVQGK